MFESANLIRQILLLFYLIVGLLNSAVAAPTLLTLTDLTNHSESTDLIPYLDVGGSLSSQIKVFAKHNGTYSLQKALKRSIGHRYRLALGPLAATTVYIQVYDPKGVARISPTLFSESQMVDSISFRHAFYAFLMSGLLVLAAYNFLYFLHIRDTSFLSLSVCIVAYALAVGNNASLLHFFPWLTNILSWNDASLLFIVILAGHHLGLGLFDIHQQLPRMVVWYYLGIFVGSLLMILAIFHGNGLQSASLFGLYTMALIIVTLIKLFSKGYRPPLSLIAAVAIFFTAGLPLILMAMGLLEHHSEMNDRFFVATLISLLLFSLTQAERIRLKSEDQERKVATNQAKDEFLTTMSHELRTPMHTVIGAGQLLRLTTLSKEQTEYVTRLNHSSSHMMSIVDDLLDLARVDHKMIQLEKEPFSLENTLNTLKQLLDESASKKHLTLVLNNHFLSFNQQLIGDVTRLNQVLINLLSNAIKFTHSGKVSLTITPISIKANHASLLFEVNDTGIGLSRLQQEALFKPFTQADTSTNRQYGGSGLGLAISQKLVRIMGGQLGVSSIPKQGSCFSFTLKFPLELNRLAPEINQTTVPKNLQHFSVLLVDDDEMNRFFGRKLLEVCGVEAEVSESAEAAIKRLQQQTFDLVLMDISMPKVDGYEATKRIRLLSKYKRIIIIALTAHAIAGEKERCINAGMNDYLTKPFELDDLQNMLIKWLGE
jgi:signal transduction histidine kinase/ActR/RegA family two-component response regulator